MRSLLLWFRNYLKISILIFLVILLVNFLSLALPYFIKLIIDDVLLLKKIHLLNWVGLGLLVIGILKAIFSYLQEYLCNFLGENIIKDLRGTLFDHYLFLSVNYIERNKKGEIISNLISDVETIRKFLEGFIDAVYSLFTFVLVGAILLYWNVKLTFIAMIFFPFFAGIYYKTMPTLEKKYYRLREHFGCLTHRINEVLNGIRIVAGLETRKIEKRKFSEIQEAILKENIEVNLLGALLNIAVELTSFLGGAVLLWVGSKEVLLGNLSLGALIAFYSYLGMLFIPLIRMVVVATYYQEAKAAKKRIDHVLLEKPNIYLAKSPLNCQRLKGQIVFENVSFSYNKDQKILQDICFTIKDGEVIAIVGASGVGKTSLLNLLLRFYDPTAGKILIDGNDLKYLNLGQYRSQLAMVLQDDYLFSATIRDNILYGRAENSLNDMELAVKNAQAYDFIRNLPQSYETYIGEKGVMLSAGQRQRLAIARAIYRNPRILILDEPTSAVDMKTEKEIINKVLFDFIRERTAIIISHRLSSLMQVDKIIVIHNGTVVEIGTHYELLAKKGKYWNSLKFKDNAVA